MAQTIASAGSGIAKETSLVTYRHLLSKQSLTPTCVSERVGYSKQVSKD